MDLLHRMRGHDAWATDLILMNCQTLSDVQLDKPLDIGIGSVCSTIVHQFNTLEFSASHMEHSSSTVDRATMQLMTELTELYDCNYVAFSRAAHAATGENHR
jgi:hypothetical protein